MSSSDIAGLSRRDFLKYCAATAALLGLSELAIPRIAAAIGDAASGKTPVIWLMAQGCNGCANSLLNSDEPTPGQLILDALSLRFFPLAIASSGDLAVSAIEETLSSAGGQYVLLVEGSIPLGADGVYATMGFEQGRPTTLQEWVRKLAASAKATIAVGTCAAYGGIPVLFEPADGKTVEAILGDLVPAVPGCPPHPDWIVGTLVKVLLFGKDGLVAQLDSERRPREFFSELVHDNCPRRAAFDAGIFVSNFNDNVKTDNACLLTKGCRGPLTHADCPSRRWNQRMNWCIGAGAPCIGCTEPAFYAGLSPLADMLPSVKLPGTRPVGVSADLLGGAIGAVTAVGVGVHLVAQVATGKIGRDGRAERVEPDADGPPAGGGQDGATEDAGAKDIAEPSGKARKKGVSARLRRKKRGKKAEGKAARAEEPAAGQTDDANESMPGGVTAGPPAVPTGYYGPPSALAVPTAPASGASQATESSSENSSEAEPSQQALPFEGDE